MAANKVTAVHTTLVAICTKATQSRFAFEAALPFWGANLGPELTLALSLEKPSRGSAPKYERWAGAMNE